MHILKMSMVLIFSVVVSKRQQLNENQQNSCQLQSPAHQQKFQ